MTIHLRLPLTDGTWFNVSVTTETVEVHMFGEALPRVAMPLPPVFGVEVVGFDAALAVVQALNPDISKADLRRLIREQTNDVGDQMTGVGK